jgi:hypothetical protein
VSASEPHGRERRARLVSSWNPTETEEIVVGRRRMRGGKRRPHREGGRRVSVLIAAGAAVLVLLIVGGIAIFSGSDGTEKATGPAIATPGGFRATVGNNHTITVGLEIRNVAGEPATVLSARIVAPSGLTQTAITVVPTGEGNQGFAIEGDLPAAAPVSLGIEPADRNAIVAARFTVDCTALLASDAPRNEQIFVTVRVGGVERTEQLAPPVVDNERWLTATARRVCLDPLPTVSAPPPLPPLPG